MEIFNPQRGRPWMTMFGMGVSMLKPSFSPTDNRDRDYGTQYYRIFFVPIWPYKTYKIQLLRRETYGAWPIIGRRRWTYRVVHEVGIWDNALRIIARLLVCWFIVCLVLLVVLGHIRRSKATQSAYYVASIDLTAATLLQSNEIYRDGRTNGGCSSALDATWRACTDRRRAD
jgi:hypothetical protein